MNKTLTAALLGTLMAVAAPASAALVAVNQSFDLAWPDIDTGSQLRFTSDVFAQPVQIQNGDTVQITVSFTGNQALQLGGAGGLQSFDVGLFQGDDSFSSHFTLAGLSLQLLGASGPFSSTASAGPQTSGSSHIGAHLEGAFLAAGESVSFTGLVVSFLVTHLGDDSSAYLYDAGYFGTSADRAVVTTAEQPNDVPEPASWALALAGLAVSALQRRRARATGR